MKTQDKLKKIIFAARKVWRVPKNTKSLISMFFKNPRKSKIIEDYKIFGIRAHENWNKEVL